MFSLFFIFYFITQNHFNKHLKIKLLVLNLITNIIFIMIILLKKSSLLLMLLLLVQLGGLNLNYII